MTSPNGLGYCPCGGTKRATCGHCGRVLCVWHHALGPFLDGQGGTELSPVCLPTCDATWWDSVAEASRRTCAPLRSD